MVLFIPTQHLVRLTLWSQNVLIRSACGGVDIAAIHICRMIGAQVSDKSKTEDSG